MPETPNHGYNVPSEGTTDWHEPLNENFEQYDTDIEIRDIDANKKNYEPKEGAKFLATDRGNVYLGDGSTWNQLATSGERPHFDGVDVELHGVKITKQTHEDSAALRVENMTTSQDAQAIKGVTDSRTEFDGEHVAAGVYGKATGDTGRGVSGYATGDGGTGVYGIGDHPDGTGVVAAGVDGATGLYVLAGGNSPVAMQVDGRAEFWGAVHPYDGNHLDLRGQNNWNLDDTDGDVRIGNDDYRLAIGVALGGGGAGACNLRAKGGINRLNLGAGSSGEMVQVDEDGATVNGDLDVTGNKNFVQTVDTDDGEREVAYTATEAGTPHTECSGVADLEDGRAEVALPEHFGWVTSDAESLVVQTTPYGGDRGLKVVERSTDHIVVEDLAGEGNYEFAYTVRGTREGQADKQVVREPSADATDHTPHAPADD